MTRAAYLTNEAAAIVFQADLTESEGRDLTVNWTDRPVEDGSVITEHGTVQPEMFNLDTVHTAWPLAPVPGYDPQRVIDADDALRELARARQPLTLVTGWWVTEVVITKVGAKQSSGDGEGLKTSWSCKTINLPKAEAVEIAPSKLAPKVKKRNQKKKNGGAANGKPVSEKKARTAKAWLADKLRGRP
jgi:hypothetical protein